MTLTAPQNTGVALLFECGMVMAAYAALVTVLWR